MVHPVGVWADPAQDAAASGWVRALAATLRASGETGSYLNLDEPDDARVRWAMGERRYQRLRRVKAAWDPEDVFTHFPHIPLPAPGSTSYSSNGSR